MNGLITSVFDCCVIEFNKIHNQKGNITTVEEGQLLFMVKRVYYLYDVPAGAYRGAHAHINQQSLIVAIGGSFDVRLDDGLMKKTVFLNNPNYGLYIPSGIWVEIMNFSSGATSLSIGSTKYDANDYIRDYDEFLSFKSHTI